MSMHMHVHMHIRMYVQASLDGKKKMSTMEKSRHDWGNYKERQDETTCAAGMHAHACMHMRVRHCPVRVLLRVCVRVCVPTRVALCMRVCQMMRQLDSRTDLPRGSMRFQKVG